jgi:Sulfotransferase family
MPGPDMEPAGVGELPSGAGAGPSGPGSEPARPGSEPALRSSALVPLAAAGPAGPATGLVLPGGRSARASEPVFVLCAGRSGSTLLRFLLDAHPELACPPETRLAAMCAQIAGVWSQLEGSPLPAERMGGPPAIPGAALAGIRHTMNRMIVPYLERRGKRRYCDKSLGAAEHADVLHAVFPGAKFLCLYRHPMDVIASGIEACPWGLNGFGFDTYADRSPRNTVMALAQFWAANVAIILAVEERFSECSYRVRYEDLVADPGQVSDGIFRFLGVPPVPGLPEACFTAERERAGPSDYKIWHTSRIDAGSVGRGWSIPAALIGPALTATVNTLAGKLGYLPIDAQWGINPVAPDPRQPGSGPAVPRRPAHGGRSTLPGLRLVVAHLLSGLSGLDDRFTQPWEPCSLETFLMTVTAPDPGGAPARWRVDLKTRAVTSARGLPPGETAGARWEITGPVDLWAQVVKGQLNLSVALRHRLLRYCDAGDPTPAMLNRVAMLADLLGITTWQWAGPLTARGERPRAQGPPRSAPGRAVPAQAPRPLRASALRASGPGRAYGRAPGPGPRPSAAPAAALPPGWRASVTATLGSPSGAATAARRRPVPPGRAGDPADEGRSRPVHGADRYVEPHDDAARPAPAGHDAARARQAW